MLSKFLIRSQTGKTRLRQNILHQEMLQNPKMLILYQEQNREVENKNKEKQVAVWNMKIIFIRITKRVQINLTQDFLDAMRVEVTQE